MSNKDHLAVAETKSVQAHTPGPWTCEINGIATHVLGPEGCWPRVVADLLIPVWAATDPDDRYGVRARVHADTRLIAAAPDLLAELQNIANANQREWEEAYQHPAHFKDWAQSRCRAAIAKATGAAS